MKFINIIFSIFIILFIAVSIYLVAVAIDSMLKFISMIILLTFVFVSMMAIFFVIVTLNDK